MAIPVSSINPSLTTPVINRFDPGSLGYIAPAQLQSPLNETNPVSGTGSAQEIINTLESLNDVRPFVSELSTSTNNLLGELNDQLNTSRLVDGLAQAAGQEANNPLNPDTPAFAAVTPALNQQQTQLTPDLASDPLTGEQLTTLPVTSFDPADTNLDGNISPQEDFEFSQQNPVTTNAPATQAADTNGDGTVSAQENAAFLQQNDDVTVGSTLDNGSLSAQGVLNQQAAERQAALLSSTYGPNTNLGGEQTSSGGILSLAA